MSGSTTRTVGQCIQEARGHLNDTNAVLGYRYADADLYGYFSNAVAECKRLRPDLFLDIGLRQPIPVYAPTTDVNTDFPVDDQYFPAFAFYVTGRAELRDDEFNTDGRAAQFLNSFNMALTGSAR